MKLTDGERLITVMLSEVMEHLDLDGELDPSLIKKLVCGGDEWALKRKYSGIFGCEPPADGVVSETTDILWMWGIIESSIAKLEGAEAETAKGWHYTNFGGFDGNNDPHYGVAQTMVRELGEFADFAHRDLNSHSQSSLPRYREMYGKFETYVHSGNAAPLSFEALTDICS